MWNFNEQYFYETSNIEPSFSRINSHWSCFKIVVFLDILRYNLFNDHALYKENLLLNK